MTLMIDEIKNKNTLWNKYYTVYTPTILGSVMYNAHRQVLKRVMENLQLNKDISILDLGCGQGSTLTSFRDWGYNNSIGIDLSEKGIERCVELGFELNKDVYLLDGTNTGWEDKKFQIVFSEGTLEHYTDFTPFVKEMTRLADKYVIIVQPNHFALYSKIIQFGWNMFRKNSGGVKELTYKFSEFYEEFAKHNFLMQSTKYTLLKENGVIVFERVVSDGE